MTAFACGGLAEVLPENEETMEIERQEEIKYLLETAFEQTKGLLNTFGNLSQVVGHPEFSQRLNRGSVEVRAMLFLVLIKGRLQQWAQAL